MNATLLSNAAKRSVTSEFMQNVVNTRAHATYPRMSIAVNRASLPVRQFGEQGVKLSNATEVDWGADFSGQEPGHFYHHQRIEMLVT